MGRSAEQGRLKDVGRSTWLSGWASTSFRGATRDRQQGRGILGRESGWAVALMEKNAGKEDRARARACCALGDLRRAWRNTFFVRH